MLSLNIIFPNKNFVKIKKEIGDKRGLFSSYQNLGVSYYTKGSYDKTLSYYLKSLNIAEEIDDNLDDDEKDHSQKLSIDPEFSISKLNLNLTFDVNSDLHDLMKKLKVVKNRYRLLAGPRWCNWWIYRFSTK